MSTHQGELPLGYVLQERGARAFRRLAVQSRLNRTAETKSSGKRPEESKGASQAELMRGRGCKSICKVDARSVFAEPHVPTVMYSS